MLSQTPRYFYFNYRVGRFGAFLFFFSSWSFIRVTSHEQSCAGELLRARVCLPEHVNVWGLQKSLLSRGQYSLPLAGRKSWVCSQGQSWVAGSCGAVAGTSAARPSLSPFSVSRMETLNLTFLAQGDARSLISNCHFL